MLWGLYWVTLLRETTIYTIESRPNSRKKGTLPTSKPMELSPMLPRPLDLALGCRGLGFTGLRYRGLGFRGLGLGSNLLVAPGHGGTNSYSSPSIFSHGSP